MHHPEQGTGALMDLHTIGVTVLSLSALGVCVGVLLCLVYAAYDYLESLRPTVDNSRAADM